MEKIKIAISPEDRSSNIYHKNALWNGKQTNEHEQMCRFADALETHLVRCGFEVYNMQFGNMYDRVAYADSMGVSLYICLLYTSPSPRDLAISRMPSSA